MPDVTANRIDLRGCSLTAKTAVKAAGAIIQGAPLQEVSTLISSSAIPTRAVVRAALHLLDGVARLVDSRTRAPGGAPVQIHIAPLEDPALLLVTGRVPGVLEGQVVAAMQSLRRADPRGDAVASLASEGVAAALVVAYMTAQMVERGTIDDFLGGVESIRREDSSRRGQWVDA